MKSNGKRIDRHEIMSRIHSKNTSIEILLRKALWHERIRYRINYKKLPGTPDIAIMKYRIAIFCDGELWHGKNWSKQREKLRTNRDYWISKIEKNMTRDNIIDDKLFRMGWIVLRFWGKEIEKDLEKCVWEIRETIIYLQTFEECDNEL
jgi:DNA mismatch endonuclease (patch repair protein)